MDPLSFSFFLKPNFYLFFYLALEEEEKKTIGITLSNTIEKQREEQRK